MKQRDKQRSLPQTLVLKIKNVFGPVRLVILHAEIMSFYHRNYHCIGTRKLRWVSYMPIILLASEVYDSLKITFDLKMVLGEHQKCPLIQQSYPIA